MLRLCHIGRETADEFFQLLALFLGFHALVLSLTQGKLRRLIPERVVTGEDGDLAEVDVDGLRGNSIEEVTVVADDENALLKRTQVFFQPLNGVEVEVVGRLVEQQVVGVSEERLGQHYAYLFIITDVGHLRVVRVFLDAQVLQQLCGLALGFPAIHFGKGHLEFGGAVAVFLGHLVLGVEGFALLHVLPEGLVSHEHGVHHAVFVVLEVVLLEHREALARAHFHGALVGFQLAADGAQQG